jgi:hypothetical protein
MSVGHSALNEPYASPQSTTAGNSNRYVPIIIRIMETDIIARLRAKTAGRGIWRLLSSQSPTNPASSRPKQLHTLNNVTNIDVLTVDESLSKLG